jgi:copper chaperone NosL
LYDFGHNLSPTAPIKIPDMVYQPPVFGEKMLLNFKSESYPHYGSLFLGLSIILGFISFIIDLRNKKK